MCISHCDFDFHSLHAEHPSWTWALHTSFLKKCHLLVQFFYLLAAAAIFFLLPLPFILFLPFEMESYSLGSPKNRYVVQTGATLMATLLPQSPKCWETPSQASFTFIFQIYMFYACECFSCMYICVSCACLVPMEVGKGQQIP